MVAALAIAGSALAAAMPTNGSFEAGTYTGGDWNTLVAGASNAMAMTGWTVTSGSVDWVSSAYWQAEDGTKSVDLDGNTQGAITSDAFATVPGATYVVQFWLSGNPDNGPGTKTLEVSATGGSAATYTFDVTSMQTHADMGYKAEAYSFVATGSSSALTFASATPGAWGPVVDNVSATQVIATGAQCKDGGWSTLKAWDGATGSFVSFRNQGACVSYFARMGAVPIGS
jgi:choice-of-anchor C domain-containing protein